MADSEPSHRRLLFLRHGQTDYNQRQVRCGGDVDPPLTEAGIAQAHAAAERVRRLHPAIDVIIASPLQRTRQTAAIIQAALGCPVAIEPGFVERRLGAWNGLPIAATEPDLRAGVPPPGGESEAVFHDRIRAALDGLVRRPCRLPLLVSSKGVARILTAVLGGDRSGPVGNAELVAFLLPPEPQASVS